MADPTYTTKVYEKDGGDTLIVASGGVLDIESGGAFKIAGVAVTASAAELNAVAGTGLSAAELGVLDGVTPGTVVAGKAVVPTTGKVVDELSLTLLKVGGVDKTNVVIGAASGFKIARSAAPVALDGSNPTSFAHGLTTCLAVFVQLVGSAAPGVGTSVLTAVINGANIDVYGWKPTSNADPTLVASAGTETFNWIAVGT